MLPEETWDIDQTAAAEPGGELFSISEPPVNPYGLLHMGGNAAEWVQDWYDPAIYAVMPQKNPRGPASGLGHVFRGGSYVSPDADLRTTARGNANTDILRRGCHVDGRPAIGFRCVKDVPVASSK